MLISQFPKQIWKQINIMLDDYFPPNSLLYSFGLYSHHKPMILVVRISAKYYVHSMCIIPCTVYPF